MAFKIYCTTHLSFPLYPLFFVTSLVIANSFICFFDFSNRINNKEITIYSLFYETLHNVIVHYLFRNKSPLLVTRIDLVMSDSLFRLACEVQVVSRQEFVPGMVPPDIRGDHGGAPTDGYVYLRVQSFDLGVVVAQIQPTIFTINTRTATE